MWFQRFSSHKNVFKLSKIILPKNFNIQVDGLPVINYLRRGMAQVYFGKPGTSYCDIHVPWTTQECACDNVTKANSATPDRGLIWGRMWQVTSGRLQNWSRSPTRGGRLREVPTIVIWLGKFWYFGKVVAYESWSQGEVRLYLQNHYP